MTLEAFLANSQSLLTALLQTAGHTIIEGKLSASQRQKATSLVVGENFVFQHKDPRHDQALDHTCSFRPDKAAMHEYSASILYIGHTVGLMLEAGMNALPTRAFTSVSDQS